MMNTLVVKILAVGMTLSQLFTQPPEKFKAAFDPAKDQAEVAALLHSGCKLMLNEFGSEKIDFESLLTMMLANVRSAQQAPAAAGEESTTTTAGEESTTTTPDGVESSTVAAPGQRSFSARLMEQLDLQTMLAAYKQFCKNEKLADSPVKLDQVIGFYNEAMKDLPDHSVLKGKRLRETSVILDGQGQRFSEIYADDNRRRWVHFQQIPDHVKKAFVAAEDKRFYEHKGLDLRGIVRAFANNVISKNRPQGGSTITQQVVKNLLLNDDLTFERKMREMVLATRIERILSKDEILELYLNYVFLGRASWGIEMASQSYFGKSVRDINYAEAALLAGLTKGPNFYNPERFKERALDRRQYVLNRMREDGYLPASEFEPSVKSALALVRFESPRSRGGNYFLDEIQRQAKALAGVPELTMGGYTVRSTIHPGLQVIAEQALQNGLAEYEARTGRAVFKGPEGNMAKDIEMGAKWQDLITRARPNHYDVQWPLGVIVETPGRVTRTVNGRRTTAVAGTWKVGLADGTIVNLQGVTNSMASKLSRYDLVFVRLNQSRRSTTATLRIPTVVQGGLVVLENKTGRVLAMAGGFSYAGSQLNRVTRAARQTGSTLKPFIYLAALNVGFQPNTLIPDEAVYLPPIERGAQPWSPKNYDGGSGGLVTMRTAVEKSLNLPTARIMEHLGRNTPTEGLDYIRAVTQELGIYERTIRVYPFVLGAQPARIIDMATAYATVANIGLKPNTYFIDSIEKNGKEVYRRPRFALKPTPSVDRVSHYQLRRILEGTLERGTAVKIKDLAGYVAGKTGTSNANNDVWFMGFTNDITVGVWVGYDSKDVRESLGGGSTGGRYALPIAEQVIRESFKVYRDKEPMAPAPSEIRNQIVEYPIDVYSGAFNGGNFMEVFRLGSSGRGPRNTTRGILRGGELSWGLSENVRGEEDDDQYMAGTLNEDEDMPGEYETRREIRPYEPGVEDPYQMWQRRPRVVEPFLARPSFFRNY